MKIAIQVPIKGKSSERVPNKNFKSMSGKPLSYWLLDKLVDLPECYDVFIDSESDEVLNSLRSRYKTFKFHKRSHWYAGNQSNGNHLLNQFAVCNPGYHIYSQAFITAVFLKAETIVSAMDSFIENLENYDSMTLVTTETGWFWKSNNSEPMNYEPTRMNGLPRSQDAQLLKESTGLYAVTEEVIKVTGCRLGAKPLLHEIDHLEAMDIDTMEDFKRVEAILDDYAY